MGQYPDERYMRLRAIADTESQKKIKVNMQEQDPAIAEYLKQLKKLQDEAKKKGLAR